MNETSEVHCDVLVVGTGAAGMAAALTARKQGLEVLVVEKQPVFGGSTALSGGFLWVPCNPLARRAGITDSSEAARRYVQGEAGAHFDGPRVDAFLRHAPEMVEFFERETSVRFVLGAGFPDYHAEADGASMGGRPIFPEPYDARELGRHAALLAPPIRGMTFVGLTFGSGPDMRHFLNALRSVTSAWYTAKRLVKYGWDLVLHGRNMRLFNGAALAARLYKSLLDFDIPVWLDAPVTELLIDGPRVRGALVTREGSRVRVHAKRGVVLATGGFPSDFSRRQQVFPHAPSPTEHLTMAPAANTGDGLRLAEAIGGQTDMSFPNLGSWMPVSHVPLGRGRTTRITHIMDRSKPGIIAVRADGRRFTNEGANYHEFGAAIIAGRQPTYLIASHDALRRYGLGFAKPFPVPLFPYLRSGYLTRGATLEQLASKAGIDAQGLVQAVARFDESASAGTDPEFHKGESAYERFQGDPNHAPNPCVGPVGAGPYYAVRIMPGDIGTFGGLQTDDSARVLDARGQPIAGLYAVGNDMASIFGGSYPGGGATLGPGMTFGYIAGRHLASKPGRAGSFVPRAEQPVDAEPELVR
ncbi:FAD-dependent oxidoreductase [Variovorax sp. J22R133]|uniref:FAD-dependent oxidoreductase n=1 Tax=Variovorax brevis TaxID=3053503 RepID=UPI002576D298|nr:FAD-dependent oxidoreductase [Variovorax sp. J22R133]MDM0117828.1 FAD-dependent oxidoreductase [Variovorax sp. J22R133]